MKNFAYFCASIGIMCVGIGVLIFSIKYEPPKLPKRSALEKMQDAMYEGFGKSFEDALRKVDQEGDLKDVDNKSDNK